MDRMSKAAVVALAVIFALSACSKGSQSSSSTTTTESSAAGDNTGAGAAGGESSAAPESSAAGGGQMAAAGNASDGAKVYQTNCSSCHQATGQGVPGTFPPLAGNPAVDADAKTVIHIVKYGLNGKINVKGQSYNGMMPAWGQQLSDADIASVITYVRSSWGNHGSAVTADQVKAVSK